METCLQSDLDAITAWLRSTHLCLNVGKYNCMLIGSRQRVANKSMHISSVGGNKLTKVNSVQYLGVLTDSVLSWTLQICNMVSGIRSRTQGWLPLLVMGRCHLQCFVHNIICDLILEN